MEFTLKNGHNIYYEDEGQGTTLFFLTGFGGNTEIWSGQVNYFVQRGYRVVRFDYLNHGRSTRVDFDLKVEDLAEEALELIDFLQIQNPICVGNSMGTAVLLNMIALRGWQLVQKAIFVDQSPKMMHEKDWQFGFKNLTESNFDELMAQPIVRPAYKTIDPYVYKNSKAIDDAYPFSQVKNRNLVKGHAKKDWRFVLEGDTSPVLFIMGEKSPFFNAEEAQQLKQINEEIQITVMPNVGHIPMAEDPETFNEIVLQFI